MVLIPNDPGFRASPDGAPSPAVPRPNDPNLPDPTFTSASCPPTVLSNPDATNFL